MNRSIIKLLCVVFSLFATAHFSQAFELTIEVAEQIGLERQSASVSGGIPIPRGVLQANDIHKLALLDKQGNAVTSFQVPTILGSWDDGSIKWLLLDFHCTVAASKKASYQLQLMESVQKHALGIRVTDNKDVYLVDTGVIQVAINKKKCTVFDSVWNDLNGDRKYSKKEIVATAAEMFIDLDDQQPGKADAGAKDYPDTWYFGMEGGNWLRQSQSESSTRYSAADGDYELSLFRSGRTHTIFKLEGMHKNKAGRQFGKYTLYMHFYAGSDSVRVSHTWVMTGDPDKNFVRRMGIAVPMNIDDDDKELKYSFGGAYEEQGKPIVLNPNIDTAPFIPTRQKQSALISGTVRASDEAYLVSIGPDKYYHNVPIDYDLRVEYNIFKNDEKVESGYEASGWASFRGEHVGIAAGVRDFWREHPKEVQYKDGVLSAFIWPDHGNKTLDMRRRYPEVRGSGPKRGGKFGKAARRVFNTAGSAVGVAKTTDLFFQFHKGTTGPAQVDAAFRDFQEPLRPFAGGEWNCASGVFGPLHPYNVEQQARIENVVDLSFAWPLSSAREFSWCGMYDYGDHLLEYESINWELDVPANSGLFQNWGYSGWMQEAYRTGPWLFLQYARSGRHNYFREADSWLRHHRDVDCVFWDKPDDGQRPDDNKGGNRSGGGHRHDQQHWGTYMTSYGIPSIATAHHYYLTGDGRDLDAMAEYCEWLLHRNRYENEGIYSVLYMAEALGNAAHIKEALSRPLTPGVGYGRLIFDSGMSLMLHDIQTNGGVREKVKQWAEIDDPSASFLRCYLYAQGETSYKDKILKDFEKLFPSKSVRSQYFGWAKRKPVNYRDAFSADVMPQGVWQLPFRTLEKLVFDSPFALGNNTARNQIYSQLLYVMKVYGKDAELK